MGIRGKCILIWFGLGNFSKCLGKLATTEVSQFVGRSSLMSF